METKKLPPFVREYPIDGGCIYIHSNVPIAGRIAENFVKAKVGEGEQLRFIYAAFWILEGLVYEISLPDTLETLNFYLSERQGKDLEGRWRCYCQNVDEDEAGLIVKCYNETRRHILETQADDSTEQKKIELSAAS